MGDATPLLNGHAVHTVDVAAQINATSNPSVLIVGAGIGGISLALDLDEAGLTNWILADREDGVGGTWYVNRYPGCRCDIPAVAYSHSRFQNSQWTETHPDNWEVQKYWENIVKTQGLENRLRLQHDYIKADWDEEMQLYHVTMRDLANDREVVMDFNIVVGATGAFAEPRRIPLDGEDVFQGRVIHAARWPRDLPVSALRGKNVVVVGNGCSGVQIVGTLGLDPEIKLVSLARSQQWLMPSSTGGIKAARNSAPYSDSVKAMRARFPFLQRWQRTLMLMYFDSRFYVQYEKAGAKARVKLERDVGAWMKARAPEHLKDKIVPDFPFQAKRYVFEDGYFAAINSDHCEAVYGRIDGLTADGVKVDDGRVLPADIVVLSTGYDAEHIDMELTGEKDSTNNYKTKADLVWYRGVALPNIPNYWNLQGNNWLVNHTSVSMTLEWQAAYITKVIKAMRDNGITKLQVKPEPAKAYDDWIAKRLELTTWPRVKNYWRKEGNGRIFTHYPGPAIRQWWDNAWIVWGDYEGGEKLARRQKIRQVAYAVALLVGLGFGAKRFGPGLVAAVRGLAHSVVGLISRTEGGVEALGRAVVENASSLRSRVGL